MVKTKYSREEIEVFKLRARIAKLARQLESELMQGNLWPPMQEELRHNIKYEIQRLKNRLVMMEKHI